MPSGRRRFLDSADPRSTKRVASNTRILHWYSATRADWIINPNLNRRVIADQPDTKWKAQLLADKRFRQAIPVGQTAHL